MKAQTRKAIESFVRSNAIPGAKGRKAHPVTPWPTFVQGVQAELKIVLDSESTETARAMAVVSIAAFAVEQLEAAGLVALVPA